MLPGHFTFSGCRARPSTSPPSRGQAFPSPRKEGLERREAPGAFAKLRPALRMPVHAKIPGPIGFEGGGGPGAWGPCEEPGASRRSNAMPVVGHRILLLLRTPRSKASVKGTKQEQI